MIRAIASDVIEITIKLIMFMVVASVFVSCWLLLAISVFINYMKGATAWIKNKWSRV